MKVESQRSPAISDGGSHLRPVPPSLSALKTQTLESVSGRAGSGRTPVKLRHQRMPVADRGQSLWH